MEENKNNSEVQEEQVPRFRGLYRNVKISVTDDCGNVVLSKKKPKVAPGEMENVKITPEMLKNMNENSEITVRIEE